MATIEIPNVRQESTVLMPTTLKDNGVAVDWSGLQNIKAYMYSDAQRVIAGKCDVEVDGEDATVLKVTYAATRPQYLGVNSLLVRCKYHGREKSYDVPVLNFVERTAQATGVTVLDDPVIDVKLEVDEVSTSLLDGAIAAALDAAVKAEEAASLVPLQVLEDCVEATENAETATAAANEAAAAASAAGITSVQASVADNEPGTPSVDAALLNKVLSLVFHHLKGAKGDTGATPNISVGTVTTGAPGTPVVITMTGTAEAPVLNITIPQGLKGDKGDQGNTGSSVEFPYELVNNLTTNDATKGLSAAQGVVLDGKISQLDQELNGTPIQFVPAWQRTGYYLNTSGTPTASSTWNVSSPFVLKKGQTVEVKTQGSGACIIAATSDGTTYTPLVNAPSGTSGLQTYKYTAAEDTTIALSVKWGLGDVVMSTSRMNAMQAFYEMNEAFQTIGQPATIETSASVASGSRLNKTVSLADYVGQIAKVKVTKTGGSTTAYRILYGSSTLGGAFNYGGEYRFIVSPVLSSIIFYGPSNESAAAEFSIKIELSPNYGIEEIDKKMFFDDVDYSGQMIVGKYINTNNSTKGSPADLDGAACVTGPINPGDILEVAGTGPTQYVGLYAFYDALGNKILSSSAASASKDNPTQIFAPEGAASFVYNANPYSASTTVVVVRKVFMLAEMKETVDGLSKLSWKGKKVVCFGDSMTEFTDPTGKRYSDYLADMTGAEVVNVGIGGTRISCRATPVATPTNATEGYAALDCASLINAVATNDFSIVDAGAAWVRDNESDDNTPIVARLKAIDWSNVDVVTFFLGTNDWGNEANMGESGEINVRTVYGAINSIISTLLTAHPNVQIFWFTPIVRWYVPWTDENWGGTKQKAGRTLDQFVGLVKDEVEKQNIPVCDMYHSLGWNKYNFGQYFYSTDGTHPTKGYINIGRKIAAFISANRTF